MPAAHVRILAPDAHLDLCLVGTTNMYNTAMGCEVCAVAAESLCESLCEGGCCVGVGAATPGAALHEDTIGSQSEERDACAKGRCWTLSGARRNLSLLCLVTAKCREQQ